MSRKVEEWIGKTDDTPIPSRVRVRVFERYGGVCRLSGRPIRAGEAWDLDHIIPLIHGGEHREFNLAPALKASHKEKTKLEMQEKSRVYHKKAKNLGISLKKKSPMPGSRASGWKRKMNGQMIRR